jgi:hypothetical protein
MKQAKLAEQEGEMHVAHTCFRTLLLEHVGSKETAEATSRMKSLGQQGDFGASFYSQVRDDLFDDASLSEGAGYHADAVQQECNAWLVEAYHGDCNSAEQGLNLMLDGETDLGCRKLIGLALLERKTYLNCGGLLAADEVAILAKPVARMKASRSLLFSHSGTQASTRTDSQPLPKEFSISKCYPNPFNPVCTVKLDVPVSSNTTVALYNMRGQHVAQIVSGELDAGRHEFTIDGSSLASGVYIVRAESEHATSLQKVMLLK